MNHRAENDGTFYPFSEATASLQHQFISTVVLLFLGYYVLSYFDSWPASSKRFLYESTIRAIPSRFILVVQNIMTKLGYLHEQNTLFGAKDFGNFQRKEEAIAYMLGQTSIPSALRKARTYSGYDRLISPSKETGPPGLGNWDNSCYQNSVLQGVASLISFRHYAQRSLQLCQKTDVDDATTKALAEFVDRLAESDSPKSIIWTPSVLKSMDSWQQQDAQEYFSRVLDAVEKEALRYTKTLAKSIGSGLSQHLLANHPDRCNAQAFSLPSYRAQRLLSTLVRSPLDGLQAQALKCQFCGFSEGISLTPFNCLTLSLGFKGSCHLEQLLDEYTTSELIEGVECDLCTAERNKADETKVSLTENNLQVTKQTEKVLRTKAKQITLGRLPTALVFHINRSVYDEFGNQKKNPSFIKFEPRLEILGKWCVPFESDVDLEGNGVKAIYQLRSIVTHQGRHDNGHYVAYAIRGKEWYCFNDEIVTRLTLEEVLRRGNVFMLFYEVLESSEADLLLGPGEENDERSSVSGQSTQEPFEDSHDKQQSSTVLKPSSDAEVILDKEQKGAFTIGAEPVKGRLEVTSVHA